MTPEIALHKEHISPIGTVITVRSDKYGAYQMRCVVNLDHFPGQTSFSEHMKLQRVYEKLHGIAYKITDDKYTKESRYSSLFVAIDIDNNNWFKENEECQYVKATGGKNKSLPVSVSEREIKKIIQAIPTKFILE
jgi:hypothetical protein